MKAGEGEGGYDKVVAHRTVGAWHRTTGGEWRDRRLLGGSRVKGEGFFSFSFFGKKLPAVSVE